MKNKAFTLIELLLALGIVGAIAALTVPSIVANVNQRAMINQLKNITQEVSFIVDEELLNNNTKKLDDTDLINSGSFYSHFEIAKRCNETGITCWAPEYKKLSDLSKYNISIPSNDNSVMLKNGVVISYSYKDVGVMRVTNNLNFKLLPSYAAVSPSYGFTTPSAGEAELLPEAEVYKDMAGVITIDLNGTEGPNIIGRDLFMMTIEQNGRLQTSSSSKSTLKTYCQGGAAGDCFSYLIANEWKMDY